MSQVSLKQESIPVGCVPSAAVAVGGGGSACRGVSTCLGGVCPSACWDTCLGGEGVCPSACGDTAPSVNRILGTRLWKHYLSATTVADGNKPETSLKRSLLIISANSSRNSVPKYLEQESIPVGCIPPTFPPYLPPDINHYRKGRGGSPQVNKFEHVSNLGR